VGEVATRSGRNIDAMTRNVTAEAATRTAYSQSEAAVYDERRFTTEAGRRIHGCERDLLLRALRRLPKGGTVLEVGCGTGRLLCEVLNAGYKVDGVDASGAMLEQLKKKIGAGTDLRLIVSEAGSLPIPAEDYDFVYCIRLLNQTESPGYALDVVSEMFRVTRPGGFVLVEFVNDFRPRWGAARKASTTRLRPAQVVDRAMRHGGRMVSCSGAFFFGMQAYQHSPKLLLPWVDRCDRALTRLMPRLTSRPYIEFAKR